MMTKSLLKAALLPVVFFAHAVSSASAAAINWGARTDYGVALANGTAVPVGNLVLLGNFGNLTPAQIQTASFATLQSNFINYSAIARHIGDGSPASGGTTPTAADAGLWLESNDTNSTLTLGISGATMYYWVVNSTTLATATQQGIFTAAVDGASATIRANWVFPSDAAIPPTATNDLDNVLPYTTGRTGSVIDRNSILVGNYGTGTVDGLPAYDLAIISVPEPSSGFLVGGAAVGFCVFALRRRFAW